MVTGPVGPGRTPLIVVVGETASGKSALAMALAERFKGEIISADSWQVYKGFDIGTAKPTLAEQARVPHHCIDVAEPTAGFSAPEFQRLARLAMADIYRRGKVPILAGGTGLYVDSIIYDYRFLPAPPAGLRAELSALSLAELHERVRAAGLDLESVDPRNKRRVIRLLETDGQVAQRAALRSDTLVFGIRTDRTHLRERITGRVEAMLAAGLEEEVARLAERYGWEAEPMKGIGYREWRPYSEAGQSLAQTRDRIIAATMGLAKRQRTWFRRNDCIQWLPTEEAVAQSVAKATSFLNT